MSNFSNLDKAMKKLGLSTSVDDFDSESYLKDREELEKIANSLPADGVLVQEDCVKLLRLCIRGMNICDYWLPKLHVLMSLYEVKRDQARADAYLNASSPKEGRLTVEMRKASAEANEEYNKMKLMVERIKSSKTFHEKKKDTLKAAYFMFKDQIASYKTSDKVNSGESLEFPEDKTIDKKVGKVGW